MTDLLERTPLRGGAGGSQPPGWLSGAAAGLAAAVAGAVVCIGIAVLVWLSGDGGSFGGAVRGGVAGWLLGHGYEVQVTGATVAMVPLGLTLLVGAVLLRWCARAARTSGARSVGEIVRLAGCATAAYSAPVVAAGVLPWSDGLVHAGRGPGLTLGLALVSAVGGAARIAPATLIDRLPVVAVPVLRGAAVGALTLLGAAALVLAVAVALRVEPLGRMLEALDPGMLGGALLVLLSLALLPNAVLLLVGVVLGPGASIGAGTSITLTQVSVGPLPAVPWLAAVPESGPLPVWTSALAALPVLAGVVAGAVSVRSLPVLGMDRAAGRGLLAGAFGGLLVTGALALAGGPVGPGRMAETGVPLLACLAVSVASLAVGGLLGGMGARLLGRRGG